ncbi:Pyruvate kinase, partial [Eumeta japonica]
MTPLFNEQSRTQANVPICMRSQLLISMTTKILPLRSELLDISNCILDGTDALMLTAETAVGEHPVECVATMAAACLEAEACVWTKQLFQDLVEKTTIPCDHTTSTAIASVLAAQRVVAAAIVVVTTSGKSAQAVSKYKPKCPIIAVTRYPVVARYLQLYRAVMPLIYE